MKKLFLLPVILLFTAATYGPPFSVSDFSSLTNRPNPSSVNPVGIVLGKTNAYDGNGGIFVFTPSSTNAVDDDIYLTTTTTGRWVRLTRDLVTISSPLVLSNGTLSLAALTNYFTFLAGTNMQVTVTSNTVTYAMTNTTGGGSGNLITVNGGLVTNFWDNGYITFLNAGGGDYSLNIGDDTISTNKINSTFYNWVLSLSGGGGGTTNGLGVNGTFRTDWNAINSAEIAYTVSAGTNWYGSLVAGSVGANKLATTGTGTSTNFLAGDYSYKQVTTNMIPGLNAILATIGSGGGSGGGIGTNFILNGVMKQPAIITNGLSVIWSTNANGHVQAEVSLVDTNIPSTIARLDSPTFTGTVTFDTLVANTLQIPFASRYAAANSSSNLVATSDGASWTNLNGSSIATGAVADARIDAALARLASPTFTGDPKAPTASPGDNDTSIASTAFVTAAVAAGGGSGGTGTVVTASGGSDMSRANITTNGFGLLVTQSGTNILLSTTNNYPAGYYAGGFLPLFAGVSNALTGDLSMDQSSDVRLFMSETSRMLTDGYEVMGLRAYNGKLALHSFATNDLSAAEEFMVIDPTDTTGPTDIITFPNSGFNNKVVFEADVEFNGTTTFNDLSIGTITVVTNLTVPNNAYGAGWNGSTNVPNENSVYDEMELRAPKDSPAFTTSVTIGETNVLDYASTHLTESEASALYQRTNAVLTATVAGTVVSVAQTNAVSFGAPTLYVGTTNVAVAVAAKAPIAGPSFTGTATNTGSFGAPTLYVGSTNVAAALASAGGSGLTNGGTIASGTITNLTTAGITMDGQTRTNWSTAFAFFQESHFSASDSFGSQFGTWPWSTIALSGGTITRMDALAGGSHPGIYRPNSGANANGGMAVRLGVNNQFLVTSNLIDEVVFRIEGTNEIFHAMGWSDAITAADPVDCLETTIGRGADYNLLEGRARSNSSETVTSDGYRVSLSTWYRRTIEVNGDATEATFRLYSGDSYPGTLLWSNTVSANLPTGSGRVLGHGTIHWKTSSGSSTALMLLDYIAVADGEGKKKKSW